MSMHSSRSVLRTALAVVLGGLVLDVGTALAGPVPAYAAGLAPAIHGLAPATLSVGACSA